MILKISHRKPHSTIWDGGVPVGSRDRLQRGHRKIPRNPVSRSWDSHPATRTERTQRATLAPAVLQSSKSPNSVELTWSPNHTGGVTMCRARRPDGRVCLVCARAGGSQRETRVQRQRPQLHLGMQGCELEAPRNAASSAHGGGSGSTFSQACPELGPEADLRLPSLGLSACCPCPLGAHFAQKPCAA